MNILSTPSELERYVNNSDNMESKSSTDHVEELQASSSRNELGRTETMGTVKLTEGKIVYIPAPSADPQGKTMCILDNLEHY